MSRNTILSLILVTVATVTALPENLNAQQGISQKGCCKNMNVQSQVSQKDRRKGEDENPVTFSPPVEPDDDDYAIYIGPSGDPQRIKLEMESDYDYKSVPAADSMEAVASDEIEEIFDKTPYKRLLSKPDVFGSFQGQMGVGDIPIIGNVMGALSGSITTGDVLDSSISGTGLGGEMFGQTSHMGSMGSNGGNGGRYGGIGGQSYDVGGGSYDARGGSYRVGGQYNGVDSGIYGAGPYGFDGGSYGVGRGSYGVGDSSYAAGGGSYGMGGQYYGVDGGAYGVSGGSYGRGRGSYGVGDGSYGVAGGYGVGGQSYGDGGYPIGGAIGVGGVLDLGGGYLVEGGNSAYGISGGVYERGVGMNYGIGGSMYDVYGGGIGGRVKSSMSPYGRGSGRVGGQISGSIVGGDQAGRFRKEVERIEDEQEEDNRDCCQGNSEETLALVKEIPNGVTMIQSKPNTPRRTIAFAAPSAFVNQNEVDFMANLFHKVPAPEASNDEIEEPADEDSQEQAEEPQSQRMNLPRKSNRPEYYRPRYSRTKPQRPSKQAMYQY